MITFTLTIILAIYILWYKMAYKKALQSKINRIAGEIDLLLLIEELTRPRPLSFRVRG